MGLLKRYRDDSATNARNKWFTDNWRLIALTTTLLAECSNFILNMNQEAPRYKTTRKKLIAQVQRVNNIREKLERAKLRELSSNDPKATLISVYEELSKTEESRDDYPIYFLETYSCARIQCGMIRAALGGSDTAATIEAAFTFAEWLDLFAKRFSPDGFGFGHQTKEMLKATLSTADEWRRFAAEAEESAGQGRVQVVHPQLFRRWLILAGIKPCG